MQQPNSPVCGITQDHVGHMTASGVTCPGLPNERRVVWTWPYATAVIVFWLLVAYTCTNGFYGALDFRN